MGQSERWYCSSDCAADSILEEFVQSGKLEQSTLDDYRRQRRLSA
jgi:hypothetical protein